MITALLSDGTVAELPKDCGCLTHEGPHWVHMDRLHLETNRELRTKSPQGFLREEIARLKEKLRNFESRGIVELRGVHY